jgi:hypothetical protein
LVPRARSFGAQPPDGAAIDGPGGAHDVVLTATNGAGSLLWQAPEVLRGDPYGLGIDVYR